MKELILVIKETQKIYEMTKKYLTIDQKIDLLTEQNHRLIELFVNCIEIIVENKKEEN